MIKIKICGITKKEEIKYLNMLKPEYIGFVFTKSKRQVTGDEANKLCLDLNGDIKKVGVFRNNSTQEILEVLEKVPLDVIQLHGSEEEDFIKLLRKNIKKNVEIWKAASIRDIEKVRTYILSNKQSAENKNFGDNLIDNFLIDGDNPGSGETFSLENINEYFKDETSDLSERYNFFLAGGITTENVIERLTKANPIGVDVSSGVEDIDENGNRIKSFEKMKILIERVRGMSN